MTDNEKKTSKDISGNIIEKDSDETEKIRQDTMQSAKKDKMLIKTIEFLNNRIVRVFLFIFILCFLLMSAKEYCMGLYMISWFLIVQSLKFIGFYNTIIVIILSMFLSVMFLIILSTVFIFLPLFGMKLFINKKQNKGNNVNKYQEHNVKKAYIIFLFLPLVILITVCGLSYSGFCFKKMNWLSKKDKTQILISSIIENQKDYTLINGIKKRLIKYNNAQEFLAINPDFVVFKCQNNSTFINDYDGCPQVLPIIKLQGKAAGTAFFSYNIRYKNNDNSIGYKKIKKGIVVITNCGEIVKGEWSEIFR